MCLSNNTYGAKSKHHLASVGKKVNNKNMKTHTVTKQRMLLKKEYGTVSSLFILDDKGDKIPDTSSKGRRFVNAEDEPIYKLAICLNDNLI
tara:strand:+ start:156 stop:428 length:273 start_codon:yes stop_codon:yes gene_type:complete